MPIGGGFVERAGRRLMRQRGARIERSFAHLYDTGGCVARICGGTHEYPQAPADSWRAASILGLVMRHLIGSGTPRGLQDRPATVIAALFVLLGAPPLVSRDFRMAPHSSRRCAGFHHRSLPSATPQR